MAKLKSGDTVKVHYTGKFEDGTVFDSTIKNEPVSFMIGDEMMLPAFEKAVITMIVGEKKTIHLKAKDAYGDYDPELIYTVKKDEIFGDKEVKLGMELQIPIEEGVASFTVISVDGNEVKLDGNSELAGKDVIFDIELLDVKDEYSGYDDEFLDKDFEDDYDEEDFVSDEDEDTENEDDVFGEYGGSFTEDDRY